VGADCGTVDAVMAAVRHDFSQGHSYGLPDPSLAPASEPAIDRVPTAIFRRDITPRRSTAKSPEYAVDDGAVPLGPSASATLFWLDRQQALQNAPFRFGKIASAQACLQEAALNQSYVTTSITLIRAVLICPKTRRCRDTSPPPARNSARSRSSGSDRVRGRRADRRPTDR
jgi:hypothetical protein